MNSPPIIYVISDILGLKKAKGDMGFMAISSYQTIQAIKLYGYITLLDYINYCII